MPRLQNLYHLATVNLTPPGRVLQMRLSMCVYHRVPEKLIVTFACFWPGRPVTRSVGKNDALSPGIMIAFTRPVEPYYTLRKALKIERLNTHYFLR